MAQFNLSNFHQAFGQLAMIVQAGIGNEAMMKSIVSPNNFSTALSSAVQDEQKDQLAFDPFSGGFGEGEEEGKRPYLTEAMLPPPTGTIRQRVPGGYQEVPAPSIPWSDWVDALLGEGVAEGKVGGRDRWWQGGAPPDPQTGLMERNETFGGILRDVGKEEAALEGIDPYTATPENAWSKVQEMFVVAKDADTMAELAQGLGLWINETAAQQFRIEPTGAFDPKWIALKEQLNDIAIRVAAGNHSLDELFSEEATTKITGGKFTGKPERTPTGLEVAALIASDPAMYSGFESTFFNEAAKINPNTGRARVRWARDDSPEALSVMDDMFRESLPLFWVYAAEEVKEIKRESDLSIEGSPEAIQQAYMAFLDGGATAKGYLDDPDLWKRGPTVRNAVSKALAVLGPLEEAIREHGADALTNLTEDEYYWYSTFGGSTSQGTSNLQYLVLASQTADLPKHMAEVMGDRIANHWSLEERRGTGPAAIAASISKLDLGRDAMADEQVFGAPLTGPAWMETEFDPEADPEVMRQIMYSGSGGDEPYEGSGLAGSGGLEGGAGGVPTGSGGFEPVGDPATYVSGKDLYYEPGDPRGLNGSYLDQFQDPNAVKQIPVGDWWAGSQEIDLTDPANYAAIQAYGEDMMEQQAANIIDGEQAFYELLGAGLPELQDEGIPTDLLQTMPEPMNPAEALRRDAGRPYQTIHGYNFVPTRGWVPSGAR
jgi:hypothetical protein